MDSHQALSQAKEIARDALAQVERAELEETVRDFETSPVPVLRSLARTYRMLQNPFR